MGQPSHPEGELPPAYSQAVDHNSHPDTPDVPPDENYPLLSPSDKAYYVLDGRPYHSVSRTKRNSSLVTLHPEYSQDAVILYEFLRHQTRLPPRPHLAVKGIHTETKSRGKDTKSRTITDFDFQINLTRALLPHEDTDYVKAAFYTSVVSDQDGQKAYRGGRLPSRSGTSKTGRIVLEGDLPDSASRLGLDDLEHGSPAELESYPGLRGWCERFCNDPSRVKSLTFTRHLRDLEIEPLRRVLTGHLRSLNYHGKVIIEPVIANSRITIYSPHWINTLRNNGFIFWACVILQLWILTWPVIWVLERRYEVVRSNWFIHGHDGQNLGSEIPQEGRLPGPGEAAIAELWAPIVRQAAWEQRQDKLPIMDQEIPGLRKRDTERRREEARANAPGNEWIQRSRTVLGVVTDLMGIGNMEYQGTRSGWGNSSTGSISLTTGGGRHLSYNIG
ncbi:hypothetical protein PHISCL_06694 [Aspergillus sclerotialis]|uniref:Uncharacterized protein n=1 Tax=Aspergillus sclerotialis TaxID=2070753 RepID=A0A3A2ZCU6_9EURO|nr:hypothetical protein PHISCL_06694 [Aspergillus sclerotialis]